MVGEAGVFQADCSQYALRRGITVRGTKRRDERMIGVYIRPESMTVDQYRSVDAEVRAAGVNPVGLKMHSCFSEGPSLAIFDVWESREAFDAFGQTLIPVVEKLGLSLGTPMFVDMVTFDVA